MNTPLISVIVPVYNAEKYLDQCIQSIVNQTYRNLEIILVDDGSFDKSPEICDQWAQKDLRIRVIHKKNGGASSARNAGLDVANGSHVGFVDADDLVTTDMYELLLRTLDGKSQKISCCSMVRFHSNRNINKEDHEAKIYTKQKALYEFFCGSGISSSVCDKLFVYNVFEKIRFPLGETNEEFPIYIPLINQSNGVIHTGKQRYFYRITEGSVTHSTWKTDADIVLKHLREMEQQLYQFELTEVLPAFYLFCAKSAYSTALHLDKNYHRINERAKENQQEYIKIMRKQLIRVVLTKHMRMKDKILYTMVATRTLRPIYKALGRL